MPRYYLTRAQSLQLVKSDWLTDRERRVAELYFVKGWRIEDVAAELDVSRKTVSRELGAVINHFRWHSDKS